MFISERERKHRSETSSGTVVRWISGWLEIHALGQVKEEILSRGSRGEEAREESKEDDMLR